MKKMNFSLLNIIMFLFFALPLQSVFAGNEDVPLKKDDPTGGNYPGTYSVLKSYSLTQESIIPVSATLNEFELVLDFSQSVGIAQITVEDQNGSIVYQDAVNTRSTRESVIETSGWDSGNYTIHISYGKTNLVGSFLL